MGETLLPPPAPKYSDGCARGPCSSFAIMSETPETRIEKHGDVTVLAFGSDLETINELAIPQAQQFLQEASRAHPPRVVVDLTNVQFFGSAFIEHMFRLWKSIQQQGGQFALSGVTDYCKEVLEVTHLNQLWPSYPDTEAAVAALNSQ